MKERKKGNSRKICASWAVPSVEYILKCLLGIDNCFSLSIHELGEKFQLYHIYSIEGAGLTYTTCKGLE